MSSVYWQDNKVRFDVSSTNLLMVPGETICERVEPVEDTKANSGESGCLVMTNLRMMWYSSKTAKLNLTIGYNTIITISSQPVKNAKRRGIGIYILAKSENGKFEFLFTPLNESKQDYSTILSEIHRNYTASKPFRELRLRHHIISANQLKVMPLEIICNRVEGVWNLASNQGNLGCFIITNVRVVWFATLNEYFNISLPYLQIAQFTIRDSKFGQVLVIESTENSGGYVLGFRIDPSTRLKQVLQEVQSLHITQIRNPELGIVWNSVPEGKEIAIPSTQQEEKEDEGVRYVSNYMLDNVDFASCSIQKPELDKGIGIAIEKLPCGIDRKTLWQIII